MSTKVHLELGVAWGEVCLKLGDEAQAWLRDFGPRLVISAAERNLVVLTPVAEGGYCPAFPGNIVDPDYQACNVKKSDELLCLPRCRIHAIEAVLDEEDGSLYAELPPAHRLPFPRVSRYELSTYDAEAEYSRVIRSRCKSWKASGDPVEDLQKPNSKFHELLPGLWARILKEQQLLG